MFNSFNSTNNPETAKKNYKVANFIVFHNFSGRILLFRTKPSKADTQTKIITTFALHNHRNVLFTELYYMP